MSLILDVSMLNCSVILAANSFSVAQHLNELNVSLENLDMSEMLKLWSFCNNENRSAIHSNGPTETHWAVKMFWVAIFAVMLIVAVIGNVLVMWVVFGK